MICQLIEHFPTDMQRVYGINYYIVSQIKIFVS